MTSITENSATFTSVYDLLHNLRAYKQGATTLAAYAYDGDGQRVTKTAGGTTTVYHHDKSGKLLSETDANGNRVVDYVYVNGNMAAKVDSAGAVSYYHVDPAGTPIAITDSTGALVWRAEYLPFGEEQLLVNTKVNDKMFIGKEKDEETGLYYFGARYLQDRNARFVSVDPVGPVDSGNGKVNEKMLFNPQKMNRYAYALNNPYSYVDPDGREVRLIARKLNAFGGSVGVHTFIEIRPDNPKDFNGERRWVIGGYKEGSKLVSERNNDTDLNWQGDLKGNYLIATPKGKSDTQFINDITQSFGNYQSGSRNYKAFPDLSENEGNCNTISSGALIGAGVSSETIRRLDPAGANPGLGKPLPEMLRKEK